MKWTTAKVSKGVAPNTTITEDKFAWLPIQMTNGTKLWFKKYKEIRIFKMIRGEFRWEITRTKD